MTILITGAAGFVGCNLTRTLLARGHRVVGMDNFCRGSLENLSEYIPDTCFTFDQVELSDFDAFLGAAERIQAEDPITEVWHMAANSDIPAGISDAKVDLRDTFMTTFNALEVMRRLDIPALAFASSSAIYGDHKGVRLHEDLGPLLPISNYGAMKLASEAAISAAQESWLKRAWIFRFPNVIGTPATHGVLLDFVRKLKKRPDRLDVLGDGTQQKSYLHVGELIDAMLFIRDNETQSFSYYNIGMDDDGITVQFLAEQVVSAASSTTSISYGEGNKGWVGDVSRFSYSIEKLRGLGWSPKLKSAEAVKRAIQEIIRQEFGN